MVTLKTCAFFFSKFTQSRNRRNTTVFIDLIINPSGPYPREKSHFLNKSKSSNMFYLLSFCADIAELRRKFEEDKERIAQLKAARRFKPY